MIKFWLVSERTKCVQEAGLFVRIANAKLSDLYDLAKAVQKYDDEFGIVVTNHLPHGYYKI